MSKSQCLLFIRFWEQHFILAALPLLLLFLLPCGGCRSLEILRLSRVPFSSSCSEVCPFLRTHLTGRRPVATLQKPSLSKQNARSSNVKQALACLENSKIRNGSKIPYLPSVSVQHGARVAYTVVVCVVFLFCLTIRWLTRNVDIENKSINTFSMPAPCTDAELYIMRNHINRALKVHQLNCQSQLVPRDFAPVKFWLSGLTFPLRARLSPGRGDCLFLSVAAALSVVAFESYLDFDSAELKDTASSLRELAVNTLENGGENPLILEGDEWISCNSLLRFIAQQHDCSPEDYCRRMRRPLTWGGGPEIVALANILGRPIAVYTIQHEQRRLVPNRIGQAFSEQVQHAVLGKQEKSGCQYEPSEARVPLKLCKVFGWTPGCKEEPLHLLFADSHSLQRGIQKTEANHFVPLVPDHDFILRMGSTLGSNVL